MLESFPQRQKEMDLYLNNIIRIANQFPNSSAFFDYHRLFAAQAEEALKRSIKVDWSYMDQTIYTTVMAGRQGRMCKVCNSMTHNTNECTLPSPQSESYSSFNMRRDITVKKTRDINTDSQE